VRRGTIVWLVASIPVVLLIAWIATNTYWGEVEVPMPPKREALINPFYAVQRFADALGARTAWDRVLTVPPNNSVLVLSAWHWNLSTERRRSIERWVESGGRLVIDANLTGGESEFAEWSGIGREYRELDDAAALEVAQAGENCRSVQLEENAGSSPTPDSRKYWMCDLDALSFLTTSKHPEWVLRDAAGIQAVRVRIGMGRVTVINGTPFRGRRVFEGDHAWLFATATQLRRGDEVHFLSEDEHPSLFALLWQHGAPAMALGLGVVILALWRSAVRFGPLAAPPEASRRSLAEQIRGVGQFALRHGSGQSLHAAAVRALDEAAGRRIPNYTHLSTKARAEAMMQATGFEWHDLAAAFTARARGGNELRNAIALLEATRRQLLIQHPRVLHDAH
jgi:hypothetical protein